MCKTDKKGFYGYVIEYLLQEDRPRIKKKNEESYNKGDWFPYHYILIPLLYENKSEFTDEWYKNKSELTDKWYEKLLKAKLCSNKDEMRIRPIYCNSSSDCDGDFEYVDVEEND